MNHRIMLHSSEKRSHPAVTQRGSALIISIFITVIILMIAIYLLDKIIPTARDIRGIENGNKAYYLSESAMNEALLALSSAAPGAEADTTYTGSASNGVGYRFSISASGGTIPLPGKGTSEYDPNWNRVATGEPIQLVLPISIPVGGWSNITLRLRVPDLDKWSATSINEVLSGSVSDPVINWILSSESDSLIASGSQIMATDIARGDDSGGTTIRFTDVAFRTGITPTGSGFAFANFYDASCKTTPCTLKLSVAAPLTLSSPANMNAPYLEYRLDMGVSSGNPVIPLQYATISTKWYAAGFRKDLTRSVRQNTTNEAADFTVFQ